MKDNPQAELDAFDWRLLGLLQGDASLSHQALAERTHLSPATCHRRVQRLRRLGLIEREVAILSQDRIAALAGWGLSALVEITLDAQTQEALDAFERVAVAEAAIQQVWRVSPGPDFVLVIQVQDMPAYQELAKRVFNQDTQVRNVRAFFSIKRAKFATALPLPHGAHLKA